MVRFRVPAVFSLAVRTMPHIFPLFSKSFFGAIIVKKKRFEPSADYHRNLILWIGCSQSGLVFETNTEINVTNNQHFAFVYLLG